MIQVRKSVVILAAVGAGLSACGGGSDTPSTPAASGSGTTAGTNSMSNGGSGSPSAGSSSLGGATTGGSQAAGGPPSAAGMSAGGSLGSSGSAPGAGSGGTFGGGSAGSMAAGGTTSGGAPSGGAGSGGAGTSGCSVAPVDPDATAETKRLLCYLYSIYGNHVLSGQQETSWSNPQGDIDYYVQTVNKHPAILGGDYLYQDGAKPGGNTTKRAQAYWNAGGLTMMRYHMGAPPSSDTYDNSKGTVSNFDNLTKSGTAENNSLNSKLDYLAGELKVLQDAKVPVLMVIYHEVDKYAWFWWSKGSGAQFVNLWKYSINYVNKTKGVHNVLWVMGYGHDGAMSDYWRGKAYADLGGIDEYDKGTQPFTNLFNGTKAVVGSTIPIPLHETGTIPQPSAMFPSTAPWLLWNVWATYENSVQENYTWNTADTIKSAYADSRTITRETLPNLK